MLSFTVSSRNPRCFLRFPHLEFTSSPGNSSAFPNLASPTSSRKHPRSYSPFPQGKLSEDENEYDFGFTDDIIGEGSGLLGEDILRAVFEAEVQEGGGIPYVFFAYKIG